MTNAKCPSRPPACGRRHAARKRAGEHGRFRPLDATPPLVPLSLLFPFVPHSAFRIRPPVAGCLLPVFPRF
ncbi:MAG: hypothetical protein R6X20_11505 [Phycisphaerae bacterium]